MTVWRGGVMKPVSCGWLLLFVSSVSCAEMKVYISADMEGVTGVVTDQQLGPSGLEYAQFRDVMTEEVNAAIRGARAAGATEILVSDSHGNGQNLLLDKLPKDVQVIRSWPRPLGMVEGIDKSVAAAVFIGYHASTNSMSGVRSHTFSSATLTDVRLNGKSVSEYSFNNAVAGYFGVPVVAISGDDAAVAEAKAENTGIEGAVVKWAISFHAARTLTPQAGAELIEAAVRRGVERRREIKVDRQQGATLDFTLKNVRQAELLSYLPGVQRTGSHSIRLKAHDLVEASRFLEFVTESEMNLAP